MRPLNILFLSSRLPSHSAGLAQDMMEALKEGGHNVTFGYPGIDEDIQRATIYKSFRERIYSRLHLYGITRRLHNVFPFIKPIRFRNYIVGDGKTIFHPHEDKPPVSAEKIVNSLKGPFDLCIILFWQDLYTTKTLMQIYEKFKCVIVMDSVDMMPMTGGCYYFGDCRKFETQCGCCPILGGKSENDLTRKNWLYKKHCYDKMDLAYMCNTWMKQFAVKSHLFDKSSIYISPLTLNEDLFKPLDIEKCRRHFGIASNKRFILLSRYRNLARKGMDTLIYAINKFADSLSSEEKDGFLLLLIGENNSDLGNIFHCDIKHLGVINKDDLIKAYNASTAFLCSSTEDAGPSMINQSIACGTPCIAYDTGTAIDVIHNGIDGFKAPVNNQELWYDCIVKLHNLPPSEYEKMRIAARELAIKYDSKESFLKLMEKVYSDFRQGQV